MNVWDTFLVFLLQNTRIPWYLSVLVMLFSCGDDSIHCNVHIITVQHDSALVMTLFRNLSHHVLFLRLLFSCSYKFSFVTNSPVKLIFWSKLHKKRLPIYTFFQTLQAIKWQFSLIIVCTFSMWLLPVKKWLGFTFFINLLLCSIWNDLITHNTIYGSHILPHNIVVSSVSGSFPNLKTRKFNTLILFTKKFHKFSSRKQSWIPKTASIKTA